MSRGIYAAWSGDACSIDWARDIIYVFDFQGAISLNPECNLRMLEAFMHADIKNDLYETITSNRGKLGVDLIPRLRHIRKSWRNSKEAIDELSAALSGLTNVDYMIPNGFLEFIDVAKKYSIVTRRAFLFTEMPLALFYVIQNTLDLKTPFGRNLVYAHDKLNALDRIRITEKNMRKHCIYFTGNISDALTISKEKYSVVLIDLRKEHPEWDGAVIHSYEGWTKQRFRSFLTDILYR